MFVELHMIQNFAPSNLNRDDTNTPKDCEFGGARRARISSQCIKRAIRTSPVFAQVTAVEGGARTRWLARLLTQELVARGKAEEEAGAVAHAFAEAYSGKMDKERTSVLLYLSKEELSSFTTRLLESWDAILPDAQKETKPDKDSALSKLVAELVKQTRDHTSAPDIALFGRMLADKPELNLDAACQVAHAISTHRVNMEMDFFTAVDDLQRQEETGAGMMGVTGFNSATFYRYANIHWEQLVANLRGDISLARRAVEGFLRASVVAVPTGKQNSFAAQNPPSFLLAVVRDDGMCWSLANAFEKPVVARESGLVGPSVKALDEYWGGLCQMYGRESLRVVAALSLDDGRDLANLAGDLTPDLNAWIGRVIQALPQEEPA